MCIRDRPSSFRLIPLPQLHGVDDDLLTIIGQETDDFQVPSGSIHADIGPAGRVFTEPCSPQACRDGMGDLLGRAPVFERRTNDLHRWRLAQRSDIAQPAKRFERSSTQQGHREVERQNQRPSKRVFLIAVKKPDGTPEISTIDRHDIVEGDGADVVQACLLYTSRCV